jgi:hypothetical protein
MVAAQGEPNKPDILHLSPPVPTSLSIGRHLRVAETNPDDPVEADAQVIGVLHSPSSRNLVSSRHVLDLVMTRLRAAHCMVPRDKEGSPDYDARRDQVLAF